MFCYFAAVKIFFFAKKLFFQRFQRKKICRAEIQRNIFFAKPKKNWFSEKTRFWRPLIVIAPTYNYYTTKQLSHQSIVIAPNRFWHQSAHYFSNPHNMRENTLKNAEKLQFKYIVKKRVDGTFLKVSIRYKN